MNIEYISQILFNELNQSSNEVPIAAAIYDTHNNELIVASNMCEENNLLCHAEIIAIDRALKNRHDLSDCILVTTLEPCLMCLGAIINANIKKIIYFVRNKNDGAFSYYHIDTQKNNLIVEFIEDKRFSNIISKFFQDKR